MSRARSGKRSEEITLDAVRRGEVGIDDVRIHPDTLLAQVMAIYEALRPGRSTYDDLMRIAGELDQAGAVRNAALVRQAADAYRSRGLLT